jgi:hypothetical protein
MAEHVIVLEAGRVTHSGTPDEALPASYSSPGGSPV